MTDALSCTLLNALFFNFYSTVPHQVEKSALKIEESRQSENLSLKDATHVGCGWIQFPIAKSKSSGHRFENFLVCNYGFGSKADTSCKTPNVEEKIITYYRFK